MDNKNTAREDSLDLIPIYKVNKPKESKRSRKSKLKRKKKRQKIVGTFIIIMIFLELVLVGFFEFSYEDIVGKIDEAIFEKDEAGETKAFLVSGLDIVADYLPENEYSRPGDSLKKVQTVFVHYTANPGTSAKQNRDYFASLGENHITSASAHFIIGYEGEVIQCIPLDEIGYAVMGQNENSISIECCYEDESGVFTEATYRSLIILVKALLDKYDLTAENVKRHYDAGGKLCPKYYVDHEDAWVQMREDIDIQE